MKRVYSNKTVIYFSIFGIVLTSALAILSIISLISSLGGGEKNGALVYGILILGFVVFLVLFVFVLNRLGCKIIYDGEKNLLYREGFICGYRSQVKIDDIKEIISVVFPKEATFYVLIDSVNTKYDGGSKNSFIRIEKNDKNYAFIRQFWNQPIEEKKYSDLFN